jgi:hypothetical protein
MRKAGREEIHKAITTGIVFSGEKLRRSADHSKVRTKARKKAYVTGAHGSASARKKAEIRQRRANRHKG